MKIRIFVFCLLLVLSAFAGSASAAGTTAYGTGAGITGDYNSFFGYGAGNSNANDGSQNTYMGAFAGQVTTNGNNNTFMGYGAAFSNTTGENNSFFGGQSGPANTTGYENTFIGTNSGQANTTEYYNTLIGYHADIDGASDSVTNATAIGYRAYVAQPNSLVLGYVPGLNGIDASAPPVKIGIGTSAPIRQLHLAGNNAVFRMDRTRDTAAFLMVRTDTLGNPMKTFVVGTNASVSGVGTFVINDLGQNVSGVGTNRMTINNDGSVTFTGNVYANAFVPSSMAYKDNIRTYENALETINKLRGVKFDWKDSGKPSVGLIAEEVEKVVPEIIAHNDGNTTGVNYASLVGVLVEAVKEQQVLIKELQEKNSRLEQLEQRLLVLEAK